MPPVKLHKKIVQSPAGKDRAMSIPDQENARDSHAKRLQGILKIRNPHVIEEIAESDLLA